MAREHFIAEQLQVISETLKRIYDLATKKGLTKPLTEDALIDAMDTICCMKAAIESSPSADATDDELIQIEGFTRRFADNINPILAAAGISEKKAK